MCEDQIGQYGLLVAGEAGLHKRGIARLAIGVEVSEPPATRCGVLGCVLDHKLNIRGLARDKRLGTAKDSVIFLGRGVSVMQSGNDRAVWEWKFPVPKGFDRYTVAQNGTQTIEVAPLMRHGDEPPVAVSGGNLGNKDRGLLFGMGRQGYDVGDRSQSCNCNEHDNGSFHKLLPSWRPPVRMFCSAFSRRSSAFPLRSEIVAPGRDYLLSY